MYIAKWITKNFIHSFFKRTSTKWDDIFIEFKLLNNLVQLIPVPFQLSPLQKQTYCELFPAGADRYLYSRWHTDALYPDG